MKKIKTIGALAVGVGVIGMTSSIALTSCVSPNLVFNDASDFINYFHDSQHHVEYNKDSDRFNITSDTPYTEIINYFIYDHRVDGKNLLFSMIFMDAISSSSSSSFIKPLKLKIDVGYQKASWELTSDFYLNTITMIEKGSFAYLKIADDSVVLDSKIKIITDSPRGILINTVSKSIHLTTWNGVECRVDTNVTIPGISYYFISIMFYSDLVQDNFLFYMPQLWYPEVTGNT